MTGSPSSLVRTKFPRRWDSSASPFAGSASSIAGVGPSGGNGIGGASSIGGASTGGSSLFAPTTSGTNPSATPTAPGATPGTTGTAGASGTSGSDTGLTGQTFGGAGIIGFEPASSKSAILIYKKKTHYNEWEFVYDPLTEMKSIPGNTGNIGQPASNTTTPVGGSGIGSGIGTGNSIGTGIGSTPNTPGSQPQ